MKIIYFSRTKNIEKFISKTKIETEIETQKANFDTIEKKKYILITYTDLFGEVPKEVKQFLNIKENRNNLCGVIGSGNRNWGENYCQGAKIISNKCQVPLLQTFELSGNTHDIEIFKKIVKKF